MTKPPAKPPAKPPTDKPRRAHIIPRAAAKPGAKPAAEAAAEKTGGERIAKVLARSGVASRRDAERIIAEGRVTVNGKEITSPALDVTPKDRITVDGKPLAAPEPPRVWLYHKPAGLVTTARDEQGRPTVFDHLPEDLPRVMTIGRLDLNSEGLLLLTNDGEIKRRLELPSTGWLRRYRVRLNGRPEDSAFDPLREGITIAGERFQPMVVTLDRQQGANAWLTIGIREGRNREIRRALEAVGYAVNRLIRISYGPFQLGELALGGVEEVRPRLLRDQLGLTETPARPQDAPSEARPARGPQKPGAPRAGGAKRLAASAADWTEARAPRARPGAAPDKPARSGKPSTAPARPAGGGLARGGARTDNPAPPRPDDRPPRGGKSPRGAPAAPKPPRKR